MSHIIFNGTIILSETPCLNVYDRGFTLGHGLFETMLINYGSIPLLSYHWDRLMASSCTLGIKLPFTYSDLQAMTTDIISKNQLSNCKGSLRLTVTDGVSERGILATGNPTPSYTLTSATLPEKKRHSMSAMVVETRRNELSMASRVKSISYLDNILAKKEAVIKGADEAFLLNSKGILAEGSVSNVFIVHNKTVSTPRIDDGALPGVVRHIILNELNLNELTIKEKEISLEMLLNAEDIFITNALFGVMPINQINDKKIESSSNIAKLISKKLIERFNYI
ncbi:MAG: aminotransferase class IV [Legionellaceae bacterium]|nr:aminotransferase class IV [Legionellaceae bacterium]